MHRNIKQETIVTNYLRQKNKQYEIKSSNILTPYLIKQKKNTVWCLWGASNCVFTPSQTTGTNNYFKNTINFT